MLNQVFLTEGEWKMGSKRKMRTLKIPEMFVIELPKELKDGAIERFTPPATGYKIEKACNICEKYGVRDGKELVCTSCPFEGFKAVGSGKTRGCAVWLLAIMSFMGYSGLNMELYANQIQ